MADYETSTSTLHHARKRPPYPAGKNLEQSQEDARSLPLTYLNQKSFLPDEPIVIYVPLDVSSRLLESLGVAIASGERISFRLRDA